MKTYAWIIPAVLSGFVSLVFIDSLRYKFIDHPKTQVIFNTLNEWAGSLGFQGIFSHAGIFSQYVIGSAELVASALLIAGLIPAWRALSAYGALIAFCIMSGAVFFHLFTSLGIDPNHDGGGLFVAAVLVWLSSAVLVYVRRAYLLRTTKTV